MATESLSRQRFRAGLFGALAGGSGMAATAFVLALLFSFQNTVSWSWIFGVALTASYIGACTGAATYAPLGKHRFVSTLAIVFLISFMVCCVLASSLSSPSRKGREAQPQPPESRISTIIGLTVAGGSPLFAALAVFFVRRRAAQNDEQADRVSGRNLTSRSS